MIQPLYMVLQSLCIQVLCPKGHHFTEVTLLLQERSSPLEARQLGSNKISMLYQNDVQTL